MNPQTDTPESAEATRHELKTWPPYFARVQDGSKQFEIRENDRDFKIGDTLCLREWDATFGYSGQSVEVVVTYLTSWNQPSGQVVLGIKLNDDLNARLQRCEEALRLADVALTSASRDIHESIQVALYNLTGKARDGFQYKKPKKPLLVHQRGIDRSEAAEAKCDAALTTIYNYFSALTHPTRNEGEKKV